MSVLITGGAGFVGSHTCVELLQAGYEIVVLDNLSNSKRQSLERVREITGKVFPFYPVDIRGSSALMEIFAKHSITSVIHFAGLKAVGESVEKPLEYYDNNVGGTLSLLKVMKEFSVKSIVFSSSATVYHPSNIAPFVETNELGAINPYGQTKLMIEGILRDIAHIDATWSVVLLRYFNPIGAHESGTIGEDPSDIPNNLMPYITQVAVGKRSFLSVFGNDYDTPDGTGIRDYIHVVDLAKGHLKALLSKGSEYGIFTYNLGTGKGYSVLEVIHTFEKATGITVPYQIIGRRPGDLAVAYADPSKALRELGWKAELDLDSMCRDAWRWQQNNPDGYGL